ncbi:MAG: putative 2-aminoethylphosphonate transport system permease protein PhnV [Spirochaetes bacterium ADurb.Bin315]|nr:MAG: putative 2-aminoethylphosphonate transport system permease protein PhnV [Spirochaetes bacterium ADurb.Bin315]
MNKKRFVQFVIAAMVFIAADIWIYTSLMGSFTTYVEEKNYDEVALFVQTAPEEKSEYAKWLSQVEEIIPGSVAVYLDYRDHEFVPTVGMNAATDALWQQAGKSNAFRQALESSYYLETIKLRDQYQVRYDLLEPERGSTIPTDRTKVHIYFVPVIADNGYEALGTVMILVPSTGILGFTRLLRIFAVGAAIAFVAILWAVMLTRDPVTSFMVLGLMVIVLIFVAYPLLEALRLSFMKNGRFSLETWKLGLSPTYIVALWGSLKLGVATATASTIIGFMIAFLVERTAFKRKRLISILATMPVISPPFSLSLSIILLFGNNGLITTQLLKMKTFSIYGLGGLTVVQTISMFPIAFLTISGVLKQIDSTVEDASLDLSATRWQTFRSITLPLATPGILSAWMLVFTNSLADFANPQLLAGSLKVLSTEAYMIVTGRMNDLGGGAMLSFLLLLPTLTAFMVQRFWVARKSFVTVTGKPSTTLADLTSKRVRTVLSVVTYLVIGFIMLLYLTIVAGAFVKNWGIDYTFTLSNWKAVVDSWEAIKSTVLLSLIAAPTAGLLSMIAAMLIVRKNFPGKRFLEVLMMTPYAIPGTLVGISYIIAFNKPPLMLVGTAAIIVINYVIRELPVGLENGITALHQIDPSIEEAAHDLGADVPTVFRTIVLPLVRPAFISSMSYTFVRAMTAVSAIIFLTSAKWYHLTVKILSYSENIRFGLASVLCTVLIIIVLGVFGLMQLLVKDEKLTQKSIAMR